MVADPRSVAYGARACKQRTLVAAQSTREEPMKDLRSSRRLIKMRQRRVKATSDAIVDAPADMTGAPVSTLSAYTASGLAIETQIRKAWRPSSEGLAIF
jgi:hypothetical protein